MSIPPSTRPAAISGSKWPNICSRPAKRYQRYYHSAAALLRQGFPELTEPQTMICQLLAQVPEESLAGLCDRQAVEEAAS